MKKILNALVFMLVGFVIGFLIKGGIEPETHNDVAFAGIGVVIGFLTNLLTSYVFLWVQFEGPGGHRMKVVADATHAFRALDADTNLLRNKYRYGLGLPIDELRALDLERFKKAYKDEAKVCPSLIEGGKDRWDSFNRNVRPVLDDLNAYELLRTFSILPIPAIRQLESLVALCNQIEIVVMNLDGLADKNEILDWQTVGEHKGMHLVLKPEPDDSRVKDLCCALRELKHRWDVWEEAVGAGKPASTTQAAS